MISLLYWLTGNFIAANSVSFNILYCLINVIINGNFYIYHCISKYIQYDHLNIIIFKSLKPMRQSKCYRIERVQLMINYDIVR